MDFDNYGEFEDWFKKNVIKPDMVVKFDYEPLNDMWDVVITQIPNRELDETKRDIEDRLFVLTKTYFDRYSDSNRQKKIYEFSTSDSNSVSIRSPYLEAQRIFDNAYWKVVKKENGILYIEDENSTMEFGITRDDEYDDWEFEPNTIPKRYDGIVFDCLLDIESFMEDIDEIAKEYL